MTEPSYDTHRRYTADEFAKLPRPLCPVCGVVAEIDRIYATANEEEHAIRGDLFIAGRWSCPRGCNLITGQRLHESYKVQSRDEGFWFECSCGFEDLITTKEQRDAVLAEHKPGTYS
jgi:hypothetical protein